MADTRFTSEELPPGWVMLIAKNENGQEAASCVQHTATNEHLQAAFNLLVKTINNPPAKTHDHTDIANQP